MFTKRGSALAKLPLRHPIHSPPLSKLLHRRVSPLTGSVLWRKRSPQRRKHLVANDVTYLVALHPPLKPREHSKENGQERRIMNRWVVMKQPRLQERVSHKIEV
jgi:hypothetical protein